MWAIVAPTEKAWTAAACALTPPSIAVQWTGLAVCSSRICAFRVSRAKRAIAVFEASAICICALIWAFA